MGAATIKATGAILMNANFVICFSGRIGSGKSSVAQALADALGWSKAGFGDYLRTLLAAQGNTSPSREQLQDLGQSLVEKDPDLFVLNVLRSGNFSPGQNLLLDGIRHVEIYQRVVRLASPSLTRLIHLSIDDAHALDRVSNRPGGIADHSRAEDHVVESELATTLPSIANFVIDSSAPVQDTITQCLNAMEKLGVDPIVIGMAKAKPL